MKTNILIIALFVSTTCFAQKVPAGYTSLFNGKDLSGWKVPEKDNSHWKVVDGVIDYDASSEAEKDKHLWTTKTYKDFTLMVDWRIKETPFNNTGVPIILPSGLHKLDVKGEEINMTVPDSDSGILLRGFSKAQANIWCWPIGSGEVYGYRMDEKMSPEVRRGVTPKVNADKNIGEWNTFEITLKSNVLTVKLNGIVVIDRAALPGLPESGPIGLQHHGEKENGVWTGPPSLVQFRNVYIKEL
jgi:hypothetical protein